MAVFTLSEIWIYPIKSLSGIPLTQGIVKRKGLQFDRRWMLIDDQGVAMTQRVHPRMALLQPEINGDTLRVYHKQKDEMPIGFPVATPAHEPFTARIWNDDVRVIEVDAGVSQWFSAQLGMRCRLVAFPESNPRPVDPAYATGSEDQVGLADAYPFLMIGQASLDDLNRRLDQPVPMNRFRPNFVFTGADPFAEDHWKRLRIGGVSFAAVKQCDRCVLTTVDQDTAVKGAEPLRTLSAYRKAGNKVFFGQNLIAFEEGIVSVGDSIIPG